MDSDHDRNDEAEQAEDRAAESADKMEEIRSTDRGSADALELGDIQVDSVEEQDED